MIEKETENEGGTTGLDIAGFRMFFNRVLKLESSSAGAISILNGRYAKFRVKGRAGCKFDLMESSGAQKPFKPLVSFKGTFLSLERGDFMALLDTVSGHGVLRAAPNAQCLDAFLRSLLSFLLIRSGGFMLHSAGIVKKGKAYIFLGKSGAGKSTLSKLAAAAGAEVISDEINLLRFEKGKFRVYGSPFWGEMRADGRQGSWELGGVYLLEKAKKDFVKNCSGGEALRLLLRCLVNFSKDRETGALVMDNAARLLGSVRFNRLGFRKEGAGFLKLI